LAEQLFQKMASMTGLAPHFTKTRLSTKSRGKPVMDAGLRIKPMPEFV